MKKVEELLEQALQLPVKDRAYIALKLLESLDKEALSEGRYGIKTLAEIKATIDKLPPKEYVQIITWMANYGANRRKRNKTTKVRNAKLSL